MKKLLSLLLALLCVFALTACGNGGNTEETQPTEEKHKASDIALSTENFSFTRAEVSYIFGKMYSDFKLNYPDSVDMYNIDTNSSLKNQIYHDDLTWFKFFVDGAVEQMKQVLALCEAAKAEGIELDEQDRADIDEIIRSWKSHAKDYEYTVDELLGKFYNSDVTLDVMRSYIEKEVLSTKYQMKAGEGFEFTEDELNAYVKENENNFYRVDYLSFTTSEDDTSTPKKSAEKIAGAKTEEEFKSLATEYMNNIGKKEDEINAALEKVAVKGELKKEYGKFSEWAFSEGKAGETFISENAVDGEFTVYYLTSDPYLDTSPVKDIRVIKENISSHNSYQETIDYLKDLIDRWVKDGETEEAFAELAKKKSKDDNTKDNGGLIPGISRFSSDVPDSFITWLYDDAEPVSVGDTAVLKGDSCYYAVYCAYIGDAGWKYNATVGCAENAMNEIYEKLLAEHPVTQNDSVINSLEG